MEPTHSIPLWRNEIPGAVYDPNYIEAIERPWGADCWTRVSESELLVYRPAAQKSSATVILCPGGGYEHLSFINEGFMLAGWFNSLGMTAVILKYRLPSPRIMVDPSIGPLQDAQEAIRAVRRHASEWNIDPGQVIILGASAGGHLAASASLLFDYDCYSHDGTSARPDGAILLYPVISMREHLTHQGSRERLLGYAPDRALVDRFSLELRARADAPPSFLVHSTDDGAVPWHNSAQYVDELSRRKVDVNYHLYSTGGHGYGLARDSAGTPVAGAHADWPEACAAWLASHGWLER
jgi:acetyl esterase/lipase